MQLTLLLITQVLTYLGATAPLGAVSKRDVFPYVHEPSTMAATGLHVPASITEEDLPVITDCDGSFDKSIVELDLPIFFEQGKPRVFVGGDQLNSLTSRRCGGAAVGTGHAQITHQAEEKESSSSKHLTVAATAPQSITGTVLTPLDPGVTGDAGRFAVHAACEVRLQDAIEALLVDFQDSR
ncbi:hypothetical protein HPB47_025582 [Ixodes persulcatus]|uniref:Uncharacterized protein n=1 Tax=Ixodes persulcatus TaxID=34615 RepID=A0AC60Q135_IXOPE|nr:hypothetical protein HPB47_025582 [Ixodes persulcatus]